MSGESLEQLLQSADSPVDRMRHLEIGTSFWSAIPEQFTHWIEEQRAAAESCILADQSFHMADLYLEGPDAIELLSDLGVNSFEDFRSGPPPQAKQLVLCAPDGNFIGDGILFYLADERYLTVGHFNMQNWLVYNLETGDYDATATLADDPISEGPVEAGRNYPAHDGDPRDFRFEVQGPHALDVIGEVADGPLPDIPFFDVDTFRIDGLEVHALAHGMSGAPGWELFGPFEHHQDVKATILEAGREYGIREVGKRAYMAGGLQTGWFPVPVPAIYEADELRGYREWLDADSYEARLGLGGSFDSDDITDYYFDPFEMGYGRTVNYDHDFVGKEALQKREANRTRTNVTFVWRDEDVIDVFASLFGDGDAHKFMDLPAAHNSKWESRFDTVLADGDRVGFSKWCGYHYNQREYLSMGIIDADYSEPGTEVTVIWGDLNTEKAHIERHAPKEIRATVAPVPYVDEGRKDM